MQPNNRNRFLIMIILFAMAMLLMNHFGKQEPAPTDSGKGARQTAPGNPGADKPAPKPPPATDIRHEGEPRVLEVATDQLKVQLSTTGASIEKLWLLQYHREKGGTEPLELLDADKFGQHRSMVLSEFRGGLDFEHWPFKLESDDEGLAAGKDRRTIVFRARQGDVEVAKTYVFHKEGFDVDLGVTVTNHGQTGETYEYKLVGAAGIIPDDPISSWMNVNAKLAGRDSLSSDLEDRTVSAVDAPEEKPEKLQLSKQRTEWAALRVRFFAAILAPLDPNQAITAFAEPLNPAPLDPQHTEKEQRNLAVGLKTKSFTLEPGRSDSRGFLLRAGPQRAEDLEAYQAALPANGGDGGDGGDGGKVSREMVSTVNFSWSYFDRFSRWMLKLLEWSKDTIGSYGLGIVLMTLIVKLCLHPLTRKGTIVMQRNGEKMKLLAPKLKAIQEQYRDDQAKLQQATMRLYKEEGFNPAGMALGCLPMMLQMPVWIALYGSIMGAFGLRQAGFLWVPDLSRPDSLFTVGFWPHHLNLLPVLYAGLTVLQTMMTPLPEDPQQRSQAWMMRFMPLLFFFFIYSMPSAFVLYFAANAILGMGETWLIKKQIAWAKAKEPPAAPVVAGKDAPRPAPVTDPAAFWSQEGEQKLGKGKKA